MLLWPVLTLLSLFNGTAIDTTNSKTLTLYSNGYVFPYEQANGYGVISPSGLGAWTNTKGFTRVYFCPRQTGRMAVQIITRSPDADNRLLLRLDSSGTVYEVTVNRTSRYVTLPAAHFNITSTGYHCIEIKAQTANGAYLPDVQALILSGIAAANLKYNTSVYRSAAATHLSYPIPSNANIEWWYSEINVPSGADPLNAYYMTNGFNGGYMGIQVNAPAERRVLFSIWSNYDTNYPDQVPAAYAVRLLRKGAGVTANPFGGEGSGGQSYLKYMWRTGITYKLLVRAQAAGDRTIYSAWFYAPESAAWKFIAKWDKPKTGGALLGGLYSFVENFGSNGNDHFKARYGNQWVRTTAGVWIELTQASFSTTASPVNHPRFDYGAGIENGFFYMFSGGFRHMVNIMPGATLSRPRGGTPPDVGLDALPEN